MLFFWGREGLQAYFQTTGKEITNLDTFAFAEAYGIYNQIFHYKEGLTKSVIEYHQCI